MSKMKCNWLIINFEMDFYSTQFSQPQWKSILVHKIRYSKLQRIVCVNVTNEFIIQSIAITQTILIFFWAKKCIQLKTNQCGKRHTSKIHRMERTRAELIVNE